MVFPVVKYRWKSWTIKKAVCQRIDLYFELWCWRRLLSVPWTARRSNQSILREINPEYSVEELMLKVQYFALLMERVNSLGKNKNKNKQTKKKEKTHPDNGKYWRQEQKVWQRTRWLDVISNPMERVCASFGKWWWTGKPGIRKFIGSQGVKQDWETEQQKPGRVFMYSWMNLNRAFLNFWKWVEHNFLTRSLAATHVEYFVFVVNLLCSFPGWHLGSQCSSQWCMLFLSVPAELKFTSWPLFQEATLTIALAFWMIDDSLFGALSFPSDSNSEASTWNMERPSCFSASKHDLRRMSSVWKFRGKTEKANCSWFHAMF